MIFQIKYSSLRWFSWEPWGQVEFKRLFNSPKIAAWWTNASQLMAPRKTTLTAAKCLWAQWRKLHLMQEMPGSVPRHTSSQRSISGVATDRATNAINTNEPQRSTNLHCSPAQDFSESDQNNFIWWSPQKPTIIIWICLDSWLLFRLLSVCFASKGFVSTNVWANAGSLLPPSYSKLITNLGWPWHLPDVWSFALKSQWVVYI